MCRPGLLFDYWPAFSIAHYNCELILRHLPTIVFCNISDKKRRERYGARIERIRQKVFYQAAAREEKDLIVKAMGMTQGHWLKCPNGERVKVLLTYSLFFQWKNLVSINMLSARLSGHSSFSMYFSRVLTEKSLLAFIYNSTMYPGVSFITLSVITSLIFVQTFQLWTMSN